MSLFGTLFHDTPTKQQTDNALDLVTYTASLASNPMDIDSLLDRVRKISATHSPEKGLSPTDETELFKVYLNLETYLTTSDPIRTFTKQELRSRLDPELTAKLNTHEVKGDL